MFVRVKRIKTNGRAYEYLQVVETRREDSRVLQHVVANFGRLDQFVGSGDLDKVIKGLVEHSKTLKLISSYRGGSLEAKSDKVWGPVLVFERLWQERMDDALDDAETLRLDYRGNIIELGKRASSYAEIEGQYVGLMKISAAAWPKVHAFHAALDRNADYDGKDFDNMNMTTFIQAVIDRLMPVKAVPINGGWLEIDVPSDLEIRLELQA